MIPDVAQDVCRCRECGKWLIETPSHFWSCPNMHGKLIPRGTLYARILGKLRSIPSELRKVSPSAGQILDLLNGVEPMAIHESAVESLRNSG